MSAIDYISNRKQEFNSICKSNRAKTVYGFDSSFILNERDVPSVQVLVEIDEPDPVERGALLINIWDNFEVFFGQRVILLTDSSVKNPYVRESMEETKCMLYQRG